MKLGTILILGTIMLSACGEATIEKVEPAATPAATEAEQAPAQQEQPKEEEKTAAPEVFKVGESVQFNDLVITVNSVENHKGSNFEKPADGNVFKVVDVTVENKGSNEENVSSLMQTSMNDAEGYSYNVQLATYDKNQLDGAVPAGRKLRGQVAFEVPKDAKGLEFVFSEPFSSGQAIWALE